MATNRSGQKKRVPGTTCPEEFPVTQRMIEWAAENGVKQNDIADQTERFLDHHRKVGSIFVDWTAAWRTWMRNFLNPPWKNNERSDAAENVNRLADKLRSEPDDADIPDFIKSAK